jgi:hypothetical protein
VASVSDGHFVHVVKATEAGAYGYPCCGDLALAERGGSQICQVCFWEGNDQDDHDAGLVRGGPDG